MLKDTGIIFFIFLYSEKTEMNNVWIEKLINNKKKNSKNSIIIHKFKGIIFKLKINENFKIIKWLLFSLYQMRRINKKMGE